MTALALAVASALGAVCRFGVDVLVGRLTRSRFPWGVWLVNVSGSLAMGLLVGSLAGDPLRTVLGVGFLGAYTTFSTFAVDTVTLARNGARVAAVLNVIASLSAGIAGAAVGLWAAALWLR